MKPGRTPVTVKVFIFYGLCISVKKNGSIRPPPIIQQLRKHFESFLVFVVGHICATAILVSDHKI